MGFIYCLVSRFEHDHLFKGFIFHQKLIVSVLPPPTKADSKFCYVKEPTSLEPSHNVNK